MILFYDVLHYSVLTADSKSHITHITISTEICIITRIRDYLILKEYTTTSTKC